MDRRWFSNSRLWPNMTTFFSNSSRQWGVLAPLYPVARIHQTQVGSLVPLTRRVHLNRRDQTSGQQPSFQSRPTPITPLWNQPAPTDTTEPMQTGRAHLSQEEKDRRRRERLCIYCASIVADQDISEPFVPTSLEKTSPVQGGP
ncbi:unnamed protein product [Arctogadus glacialis]